MPHRARRILCCIGTGVLLAAGTLGGPAHADVVFIGPSSHAGFRVRLLWIKSVRGRFEQLYGSLQWSPAHRQGVVRAWIEVASARMHGKRERRMLLGSDFLDAARYPRIHFVSDPVGLHLLRHGGTLRGRLGMHGVTRPVTFTVHPSDCRAPQTTPCTLRLNGSVQRSRFGITAHGTLVSDRVQLDLVIRLAPP